MPTSVPMSLTSVISRTDESLSPAQIGYLQAYAQDRAHDVVRSLFMNESESDSAITRAFLARRLGKKPEQITRWLAVPGNWTLGTLAELLGAMGYVPTFGTQKMDQISPSNQHHQLLWRISRPPQSATQAASGNARVNLWSEHKPDQGRSFGNLELIVSRP